MVPLDFRWRRLGWAAAIVLLALTGAAHAQLPDFAGFGGGLGGGDDKVAVEAQFARPQGDRPALLFVTANVASGFHVNAMDQPKADDGGGPQGVSIQIEAGEQARLTGAWRPLSPPKSRIDELAWKGLELREHEGRVTWAAPIELAAGVDAAALEIQGVIEGQACDDNVCAPFELPFTASVGKGVLLPDGFTFESGFSTATDATAQQPGEPAPTRELVNQKPPAARTTDIGPSSAAAGAAPRAPAARTNYDISKIRLAKSESSSLGYYLLTALLGGLILNVMPCVLPVIGLKLMSFLQQAGESRRRALALNVWYSAGILGVFLVLAALAVTLQIGWGDQFGNPWFLIALASLVFAMALSLLGLWEIPIPGFVSSGVALEAAQREGATAAFLKGVLTTILATPCTGPYMVTGLAWAVKQPPHVTFMVFGALGLGMASPYLLVGAFPSLIRFLPKPGLWMETFKKTMGLVLLGTVVWLLSTLDPPMVVPTVALMVGITAACWWVSQTTVAESRGHRLRAWGEAAAMIAVTAAFSFSWLYADVMKPRYDRQVEAYAAQEVAAAQLQIAQRLGSVSSDVEYAKVLDELVANVAYDGDEPWQNFTLPKLARLALDERRTVLVDFTANWCASCKVLEHTVLKTDEVLRALNDADIVTMTADYTKKPAWMGQLIRALGGVGVPVIAIFPADRPYKPIVFAAGYTRSGLLDAIAEATGRSAAKTASRPIAVSAAAASER